MKIAIMQPYLFPYIGYFQLINAVDFFGIGDDSQYINKGWINRNRILINKKTHLFSFSVRKDSYDKEIKDRYFHERFDIEAIKFLKSLELHYKKAPYYSNCVDVVKSIFSYNERNISQFNENQLKIICDYVSIDTPFLPSTTWDIGSTDVIDTQDGVIKKLSRLKKMGINHFINPIGGVDLYDKDVFIENEIKLNFLKTEKVSYNQFDKEFIPGLSIIDVMMFNSPKEINLLLNDYQLI